MPDSGRSKRWWFLLGAIGALSVTVAVLSVIGFRLRSELSETRSRVTELEAERIAEDASKRTAAVAACYASARGRPRLIVILRLLAQTAERDAVALAAVESVIMDYETSTPTVPECDRRARANGLDPKDFPPTRGRGESGR